MIFLFLFPFQTFEYHPSLERQAPCISFQQLHPIWVKLLTIAAYPWNCTKFTHLFTRIPPHVALLSKMEGLKINFQSMKVELTDEFKEEFDKQVNECE